jgi:lipopolysaccharide transport system permease protein
VLVDEPLRAAAADAANPAGRSSQHHLWVDNRPSQRWLPRIDLRELWSFRELAVALALRDLKLRYAQTAFGVVWALLQPLAAAVIFVLVFDRLVGVPSDGLPYVVFVYAGLVLWTYVSTAVDAQSRSLIEPADLVTKVYFPRLYAPFAAVLPGLVDLVISLLVLAVLMAAKGVAPGVALVLLPVWIVLALLVALGVGLWLAALNVEYRDVRYALAFLLQVWLFVSPVIYPSSLVVGWKEYVYAVNPLVGVLDGFRWSLLGAPAPGPEGLVSLLSGSLLLLGGFVYFRRAERRFADLV